MSLKCKPIKYPLSTDQGKASSLAAKAFQASADGDAPTAINLRINMACLQLNADNWSAQHLLGTNHLVPFRTIKIETENLISTLALAESDSCVEGVYPHSTRILKLAALEDGWPLSEDPFANQAYFQTIGFHKAQLRLFHPDHGIKVKVPVAIIDTGADYNHPDLAPIMWSDANGNHGLRVADGTLDPMDDDIHGTHVSGIVAAATDNNLGVQSIGHNVVEIMAVNAYNTNLGGFTEPDIIEAIDFAIANGAKVINMSLGGPQAQETQAMADAIGRALNAGIFLVIAAGNDDSNAAGYFPAANTLEFQGVISVGSVNVDGSKSSFSNFSPTAVDISAPGNESEGRQVRSILSTIPGGGYARLQGTSMASPVVASAVALIVGFLDTHNIEYNIATVENLLLGSAKNDPDLVGQVAQGRVLDLDNLSKELYQMAGVTEDPVADYVKSRGLANTEDLNNLLEPFPDMETCP